MVLWVLILPMRNGNFIIHQSLMKHRISFLSYLWGMETLMYVVVVPAYVIPVLILPMRNGNHMYALLTLSYLLCSYPTYEEWKHISPSSLNSPSIIVLILPMRNGNLPLPLYSCYSFSVLILPMRNGNCQLELIKTILRTVLILPMRNGNSLLRLFFLKFHLFLSYLWGMETTSSIIFLTRWI